MNDNKISKNYIVAKFAVPISFLILFFLAANFTDCDLVLSGNEGATSLIWLWI